MTTNKAPLCWHAAVETLVLRGYEAGRSYTRREPYSAVVHVSLFGATAVASGMLRSDQTPLERRDYLQIAALVRQHGAGVMLAERDGRLVQIADPQRTRDGDRDAVTAPMPL